MTTTNNRVGIYIHVPFCLRKCGYCDFFSVETDDARIRKAYARGLLHEIDFYGRKYGKGLIADTVFFGGGTPSLMEPALIERIMGSLKSFFSVPRGCEVTMECNPATLTPEKLDGYRKAGVNRLSIGVQSFDDGILGTLGRVHTAAEAVEAVEMARNAGFGNVNVDLMFAVPGQHIRMWNADIKKALALRPAHISAYSLEIADDTPFGRLLKEGKIKETPAERDRKMYAKAIDALEEAGYEHYEISNFALPGAECRHNLKYWDMSQYLGLGAGAHSFMGGVRYSNLADVEEYVKAAWSQDSESERTLGKSKVWGADCVGYFYENTFSDSVSEFAFTALRTKKGLVFEEFSRKMKNDFWDVYAIQRREFEKFVREGYAVSDGRHIALTRKGIDISNRIMALFV